MFRAFVSHSNRLCSDLLLDEGHDADSGEDWLPAEALPRDAIGKRFGAVGHRLAQVPHEERDVGSAEKKRQLWNKGGTQRRQVKRSGFDCDVSNTHDVFKFQSIE